MRALLADDHPLYLDAAKVNLERSFSDLTITPCRSFTEVVAALDSSPAFDLVLMGGTYIPGEFAHAPAVSALPLLDSGKITRELSARETDVLEMIVQGASNKEIARALEIQEVTVKLHANRIFNKLGVKNRAQAAVKALDDRLVHR